MNEEILKNIHSHLASEQLTDSNYNDWLSNISESDEVKTNVYNYLVDNSLTESDYDSWVSNAFGDLKKKVGSELPGTSEEVPLDGQSQPEVEINGLPESSGIDQVPDLNKDFDPSKVEQAKPLVQDIPYDISDLPEESKKRTHQQTAVKTYDLDATKQNYEDRKLIHGKYKSGDEATPEYVSESKKNLTQTQGLLKEDVLDFKNSYDAFMDKVSNIDKVGLDPESISALEEEQDALKNEYNQLVNQERLLKKEELYLDELEYANKVAEGNFAGATWNAPLRGIGSVVAGLTAYAVDAVIPENAFGPLADTKDTKKRLLSDIRDLPVEAVGHEKSKVYLEDKKHTFLGGAFFGALESLPTMAATMASGGAGALTMFAQVSDAVEQETADMDISNLERTGVKIGLAIPMAMLEKVGMSNILKNKAVSAHIFNKVLSESAKDLTAEGLEAALKKETQSYIARFGNRLPTAFLAEAETGGLQEATDITLKQLYNNIKGKEMFQSPESMTAGVEQVIKGAIQEGIGGLVMGTIPAALASTDGPKMGSLSTNEEFDFISEFVSNDDAMSDLTRIMQKKVDAGEMTQDEYNSQEAALKFTRENLAKIPDNFTTDQKKKSFDLLSEKSKLTQELEALEGKDEALTATNRAIKEAAIEKIDAELAKIAETKAKPEVTKEEVAKEEVAKEEVTKKDTDKPKVTEEEVRSEVSKYVDEQIGELAKGALSKKGLANEVIKKMESAEHINDNEIDAAVDQLLIEAEAVDQLDISDKAKAEIKNELLDVAETIDNYEFRTKTEVAQVTERNEANRPRKAIQKKAADEFFNEEIAIVNGSTVALESVDGRTTIKGTDQVVETASLKMDDDGIKMDDDGNLKSVTLTDRNGLSLTFEGDLAMDLAIKERMNQIGEVPDEVFQRAIDDVKIDVERDVDYIKQSANKTESKPKESKPKELAKDKLKSFIESSDSALDWLNTQEAAIKKFEKGQMGSATALATTPAKIAIKAAKAAIIAGKTTAQAARIGIQAIKDSDWYKNLPKKEQAKTLSSAKEFFEIKPKIKDSVKVNKEAGMTTEESFKQAFEEYVTSTAAEFKNKIKEMKLNHAEQINNIKNNVKNREKLKREKRIAFEERKSEYVRILTEYVKEYSGNKYFPSELNRAIRAVSKANTPKTLDTAVSAVNSIVTKSANRSFSIEANKARKKAKNYHKRLGVQSEANSKENGLKYDSRDSNRPTSDIQFESNSKIIDSMLKMDPEMIPDNVKKDYQDALGRLGSNPGSIDSLMKKIKKVVHEVEVKESFIPVLKDIYQNLFTPEENSSFIKNVNQLISDGIISAEDGDIMKLNKNDIMIDRAKTDAELLEELQSKIMDVAIDNELELPEGWANLSLDDSIGVLKDLYIRMTMKSKQELDRSKVKGEPSKALMDELATVSESDMKGLNLRDTELVLKAIQQASNGFITHTSAMANSVIVGERGKNKVDINSRKRTGGLSLLSKAKSFISSKILNNEKSATFFKIMSIPKTHMDVFLGNVKNSDIYRWGGTRRLALKNSDFDNEAQMTKNEILAAEQLLGKDVKKAFESKIRIMMYMLQREFDSNPGNKEVKPAKDWVKATIEAKSREAYSKDTKDLIQRILDENSKSDGDLSELKLTAKEMEAVKGIDKVNKFISDKSAFTETVVRGNKFNPIVNYIHAMSKGAKNDKSLIEELVRKISNPSARAGSLKSRTSQATPISFDPFTNTLNGSRQVLMDFHLTQAIRETNEIHKRVSADAKTDDAKEVAEALDMAYEESKAHILPSNFSEAHWWDSVESELVKKSYQAILAGGDRAITELTSNMLYAAAADYASFSSGLELLLGSKYSSELLNKAISNTNTTQKSRLTGDTGLGSKSVDLGLMNTGKLSKAKNAPTEIEQKTAVVRGLIAAGYKNVDDLSTWLLSAPDKVVGRIMYLGTLSEDFKKSTGAELDLESLANDEGYRLKYKEVLDNASFKADQLIQNAISSQNPIESIGKNQKQLSKSTLLNMYRVADSFMTTFAIGEFATTVKAIKNLRGEGELSTKQSLKLIGATMARMIAYNQIKGLVLSGVIAASSAAFGWEKEEDDKDRWGAQSLLRDALSSAGQLALGRNMGSMSKGLVNHFIAEPINKEFGQGITRTGDYDKYKNGMFFDSYSNIDSDKKLLDLLTSLTGGYQSIAKSGVSAFRYGMQFNKDPLKSKGKKRRSEQSERDESTYQKGVRAAFDIAKASGALPLPKDFDFLMKHYLYANIRKDQSKKSKSRSKPLTDEELKSIDPEAYARIKELRKGLE